MSAIFCFDAYAARHATLLVLLLIFCQPPPATLALLDALQAPRSHILRVVYAAAHAASRARWRFTSAARRARYARRVSATPATPRLMPAAAPSRRRRRLRGSSLTLSPPLTDLRDYVSPSRHMPYAPL